MIKIQLNTNKTKIAKILTSIYYLFDLEHLVRFFISFFNHINFIKGPVLHYTNLREQILKLSLLLYLQGFTPSNDHHATHLFQVRSQASRHSIK